MFCPGYQRQGFRYPNPIKRMVKSNQANGPIQSGDWSNSIRQMAKMKMRPEIKEKNIHDADG
jgi:hypothetical protein